LFFKPASFAVISLFYCFLMYLIYGLELSKR